MMMMILTIGQWCGRDVDGSSSVRAGASTELTFPLSTDTPALPTQRPIFLTRDRDSISFALQLRLGWDREVRTAHSYTQQHTDIIVIITIIRVLDAGLTIIRS